MSYDEMNHWIEESFFERYADRFLNIFILKVLLSNLFSKYLEGHTTFVLVIRGTHYQYWLT